MSYTTELRELKPVYNHRDNLGRGERITLKKLVVKVNDRRDKSDSLPVNYTYTFRVGDDGIAKLAKIENEHSNQDNIGASRLIRTLPIAEKAVEEYVNDQDAANLAVQYTYARLEMNLQEDCPPITNENEAQQ